MGTGTTVSILPCGAMTADITWLLLAPGRAMRSRQNKHLPAEWTDVPTHCVLVDTPDGRLGAHARQHVDSGRSARDRHDDLHGRRGLHGRQLWSTRRAGRDRQQPGAVLLLGRETARHRTKADATIVFGHDPEQIKQLRVAPEGNYR